MSATFAALNCPASCGTPAAASQMARRNSSKFAIDRPRSRCATCDGIGASMVEILAHVAASELAERTLSVWAIIRLIAQNPSKLQLLLCESVQGADRQVARAGFLL